MSLGKILLMLGAVGAAAAFSRRAADSVITQAGPDYQTIDAYFGGAKPGDQDLPTIVLLHGEGSTPTQALKTLEGAEMFANGWPHPVRVLVPMGRFGDQKHRFYVDPTTKTKAEWQQAQRIEADSLGAWLTTALAAYASKPAKPIVVGLGANGAAAVRMALTQPALVRQAYGTGGAVPSYWAGVPPLVGPGPIIRKLSYGDGVAADDAAQAAAKERGFDFETMDLGEPPSEATVQKWLLPQLDEGLLT